MWYIILYYYILVSTLSMCESTNPINFCFIIRRHVRHKRGRKIWQLRKCLFLRLPTHWITAAVVTLSQLRHQRGPARPPDQLSGERARADEDGRAGGGLPPPHPRPHHGDDRHRRVQVRACRGRMCQRAACRYQPRGMVAEKDHEGSRRKSRKARMRRT